jgi:hypothetical protein
MPFGDFASNVSLPRVIRGLYFPPTHKEICKREINKFKGFVAIVFLIFVTICRISRGFRREAAFGIYTFQ